MCIYAAHGRAGLKERGMSVQTELGKAAAKANGKHVTVELPDYGHIRGTLVLRQDGGFVLDCDGLIEFYEYSIRTVSRTAYDQVIITLR